MPRIVPVYAKLLKDTTDKDEICWQSLFLSMWPVLELYPGVQIYLKWAHVIACDRQWLHQMEKLSLCYRNRAEITVFISEQMPYRDSVDTESVAEPSVGFK